MTLRMYARFLIIKMGCSLCFLFLDLLDRFSFLKAIVSVLNWRILYEVHF